MKEKESIRLMRAIGGIGEDMIEQAERLRPAGRRPRPWLIAAAVVGMLTLLLMTSVAASYDIGFYMSQIFGGDVEMLNEMTAKPGHVFKTGTNDDVKFEVVGITGDRTNVYVWLDVIMPDSYDPTGKHLAVKGFDATKSWSGFSYDNLSVSVGFPQHKQDNVYSMFCILRSSKSLVGQRIKLTIEDICALPEGVVVNPKYYEPVEEGMWTLSFSLNYPDLTQIYTPDVKGQTFYASSTPGYARPDMADQISVSELVVETCRVQLSPMSINISFTSAANVTAYLPDDIKLILVDGEIVECFVDSGGHRYNANGGTAYFWSASIFDEPIDPERVAAVEYCGATIPLK